jgi:hypothetical protein
MKSKLTFGVAVFSSLLCIHLPSQSKDNLEVAKYHFKKIGTLRCEAPDLNFPRWVGYPVEKCQYSGGGVSVQTYMLNPTIEQLSRWVVHACLETKAVSQDACIKRMTTRITLASSGVFPVSGFIPEPASSAGGTGDRILCPLFRDGVTITTKTWNSNPAINNKCDGADQGNQDAVRARKYARVASTTREEYIAAGGANPVGNDGDLRWLAVVRESYQQAWGKDRNELIVASAKAEMKAGRFK